jgi:hypothetical protein
MKKTILIPVIFLTFTLNLLAQGDVSKARWIPGGIVVDGNNNEWIKPLNCYDDKSGLMFAFGNDNNNLYLCFTCNDEMKMRKMMNAGWKVDFTSNEKKKKFKAEINFPAVNMTGVGMGIGMRRSSNSNESISPINSPINIYRLNLASLPIKGFTSNKTEIKLNDKSGINIAVGADSSKHIVYEFAIPFFELYGDKTVKLDEEITLNVTVNGVEQPNSSGGNYSGGASRMGGGRMGGGMSGMGGRGGGRMGGGMGSGRYGGGMSQGGGFRGDGNNGAASMFEKDSFKQKFTLSDNQ